MNSLPETPRRTTGHHPAGWARGLTLVEMLAVTAVVGVLAVLVAGGVGSLVAARGVADGAAAVSGALELAKTAARARQTYAWVGIASEPDGPGGGIWLTVVCSADGSPRSEASNLQALTKPVEVRDIELADFDSLSPGTQAQAGSPAGAVDFATAATGIRFTAGPAPGREFSKTVTFTPRGEAMLEGEPGPLDGFDRSILIGLRPMSGNGPDAAVVVQGAIGNTSIHQAL